MVGLPPPPLALLLVMLLLVMLLLALLLLVLLVVVVLLPHRPLRAALLPYRSSPLPAPPPCSSPHPRSCFPPGPQPWAHPCDQGHLMMARRSIDHRRAESKEKVRRTTLRSTLPPHVHQALALVVGTAQTTKTVSSQHR